MHLIALHINHKWLKCIALLVPSAAWTMLHSVVGDIGKTLVIVGYTYYCVRLVSTVSSLCIT